MIASFDCVISDNQIVHKIHTSQQTNSFLELLLMILKLHKSNKWWISCHQNPKTVVYNILTIVILIFITFLSLPTSRRVYYWKL